MSSPYTGGSPGTPTYGEPTGAPLPGYGQSGATGYSAESQSHADTGQPMTGTGHPDVADTSVGALISEVTRDLSTLMRQEVELAKAELKSEANKAGQELKAEASTAGKGAGMLGGAGFAGYMVALFLSYAAWWGLENIMDAGWAALIVAVVWGLVAAVLASMGRKELKKVDLTKLKQLNPKPERTVETLQQVPGALKPH